MLGPLICACARVAGACALRLRDSDLHVCTQDLTTPAGYWLPSQFVSLSLPPTARQCLQALSPPSLGQSCHLRGGSRLECLVVPISQSRVLRSAFSCFPPPRAPRAAQGLRRALSPIASSPPKRTSRSAPTSQLAPVSSVAPVLPDNLVQHVWGNAPLGSSPLLHFASNSA